jgi:signal transduction histidine kinase/uncharacterized membrane protein affecting hemolysin expression
MPRLVRWRFRDASLNQKLTLLGTVSSLVALLLAGTALITLDLVGQKEMIGRDLSTLSQVIGKNSTAALLFDDAKAARDTLSALAAKNRISSAAVYDENGRRFAVYAKDSAEPAPPDRADMDGRHYEGAHLVLTEPILLEGERIGTIRLRYDLRELYDRLAMDLVVVGLVLVVSFLLSLFLSLRLKRMIAQPLLHLAGIARQVTERNEYSLRAAWRGRDELGLLIKDFNLMLEEVQRRDEQKTRAETKFAFLAEASTVLGRSMDYEANLREIAKLSVPYLGDGCVIELVPWQELDLESSAIRTSPITPPPPPELEAPLARREELHAARERALREGEPSILGGTDPEHPGSVLVSPLIARGRPLGIITFVAAGDTRRYGEAEAKVVGDLSRRAASAVDNACLYRDAKDAIRLRDDFISIASHELKTPLTVLQLQVQAIMAMTSGRAMTELPEEKIQEMKRTANRQIQRFSKLIHDLLEVSQPASKKSKLDLRELEMSELVKEVAHELSSELSRNRCELRLQARERIVGCWDRFRIEQIVTNLMTNAMKYGAGKPVCVEVSRQGEKARVSVRDFGIGIAKADQSRIFGRFERAVSLRNFGGFGLGLFIAQQAASAHGGTIWVESEPGEGSTFFLEVPLKPDELKQAA